MKARNIIAIMTACLALTSCVYEAVYHLTNEDITWMEAYNQGDSILFSSDQGIDTMIINKKIIHDIIIPIGNPNLSNRFFGTAEFSFSINHNSEELGGWLILHRRCNTASELTLKFYQRNYFWTDTRFITFSKKTFRHLKLDDVICVDSTNSALYGPYRTNPISFSWSKSKGLIQYQYPNGEVYTLSSIKKAATPEPTIRERIIDLLRH